jgi:hypothetical protein
VNAGQEAADLCARASTRAANVQFQLADAADLRQVTPSPAFDAAGASRIAGWRPAPKRDQPSLEASFRTRIALPAGRYQLSGQVFATRSGQPSEPVAAALSMVRIAPGRWDYDRRQWASQVTYAFQVSPSVSPEEIELTIDVKAQASSVSIDASSLTLVRLGD